jgi:high-affinity Fe2+/Pb2+ permease
MTQPSWRERVRPAEFLGLSAAFAVFIGVVVLLTTRELDLSLIFLCIGFIVSLVVIAMLALAAKPNDDEQHELDESDKPRGH